MPHHFPFVSSHAPDEDVQELEHDAQESGTRKRQNSVLERFHKVGNWLRRTEEESAESGQLLRAAGLRDEDVLHEGMPPAPAPPPRPGLLGRRLSRRVVPELPRPLTFRRQNSEKRERLLPVEQERRAVSADRRPRTASLQHRASPPLTPLPSLSAPEIGTPDELPVASLVSDQSDRIESPDPANAAPPPLGPLPDPPPTFDEPEVLEDSVDSDGPDERELQAELEAKWILNLSMHFRDKSDREKFFVTYAQEPNKWRRLTVSCDYRNAVQGLEADLKTLHYQRDKSSRIYSAIRESLPEIQFYDTVTNLKLETEDGQLHVHVTEDVNEIIQYPPTSLVNHIRCNRYRESELDFEAHLSGFVYRVRTDERVFIKKEIPGPDTVDEFLYEINALDSLRGSQNVIEFHGLVTDEEGELIKGLLIAFAPRGALVDILYDYKMTDALPWIRREKWALQIIGGLSEIHEAGFVQGDFTLSNIVIDENDDAKIIDINRRGCPVGWEPPELSRLIMSGQRISMCIGVKSDLFQLGMVLWALAAENDEPERVDRIKGRFPPVSEPTVPSWFGKIVDICLSERPRYRESARDLLRRFSESVTDVDVRAGALKDSQHSVSSHRSDKEYIDPATAVDLRDIDEFRRRQANATPSHPTSGNLTFADHPPSTDYRYDSTGSFVLAERDQSPAVRRRRRSSPYARPLSSATTVSTRPEDVGEERFRPKRTYMDDSSVDCQLDLDQQPNQADQIEISLPRDVPRFMPPPLSPLQIPGTTSDRQSTSRLFHEIHDLTIEDRIPFSGPRHQDSGFDELMTASLELPPEPFHAHFDDVRALEAGDHVNGSLLHAEKLHASLLVSPRDLSPVNELPAQPLLVQTIAPVSCNTSTIPSIEDSNPLGPTNPAVSQIEASAAKENRTPAKEQIDP
ncbi:hypothetical protein MBLNU459_g6556t1 [Dothideomycetes sp. NU459]